jgi:mono/diheme cytochrome c family protein
VGVRTAGPTVKAALVLAAGAAALFLLAATPGGGARADDARSASFTQAQADQGGDLYRASCASCHGPALNDGEFAPPLKGVRFKAKWSGQPVGSLFGYISANMPPGQAGSMAPDDYANILAYLLQANGAQAGPQPLPAEAQALSALSWPG